MFGWVLVTPNVTVFGGRTCFRATATYSRDSRTFQELGREHGGVRVAPSVVIRTREGPQVTLPRPEA